MIKRLSLTLAAAVCLVGCSKPDEPTKTETKTSDGSATAGSSSTASTPATTSTAAKPSTSPAGGPATSTPASEWKTTATGLKYQVLKQGNGTASPKATDTVVINYTGSLTNGAVFDSTTRTGKPLTYPVNRFIAGWIEGLQLMKVGDKFKFEIPPNLAYADNPPTPAIPPNSTLIFEVELLEIK
jgi:FKBP-type peptidyl-prolyl cis-trans isomerase